MNNIFDKLVRAEKDFHKSEFVAPIFSDRVAVNIAGINMTYKVRPSDYRGWAVLYPKANKIARVHGDAPRNIVRKYLDILPKFSFVICDIDRNLGIITNSDNRISICQPLPIQLLENVEVFDEVCVRFDGVNFLYDRRERSSQKKMNLRHDSIDVYPKNLNLPKGWKEAYEYIYFKKQKELINNKEYQLRSSVEKAGGKYISHSNLDNRDIRVCFEIDGQNYNATIEKDNNNVVCGGICLSGQDDQFDLQSLISVVREGQNTNRIVRGDYRSYYGR